jgi:hypothetical protein
MTRRKLSRCELQAVSALLQEIGSAASIELMHRGVAVSLAAAG